MSMIMDNATRLEVEINRETKLSILFSASVLPLHVGVFYPLRPVPKFLSPRPFSVVCLIQEKPNTGTLSIVPSSLFCSVASDLKPEGDSLLTLLQLIFLYVLILQLF